MASLNGKQKQYLEGAFDNRVTFRKTERKLYGYDIGAMPHMIKPVIGNTIPDAVVQPNSEEELKGLLTWAAENRIPLTPPGQGLVRMRGRAAGG